MQTFSQTFTGSTTWTLNVTGKYFTTLMCTNAINVRFYLGGKQLDLGQISQLLAGLEVTLGDIADIQPAFDRVEVDVTGPDTIQIGIGNGQARYNRSQGSVAITNVNGAFNIGTTTVTTTNTQLRAPNANRRYLLIQNNDPSIDIYVRTDSNVPTITTSVKIPAGGSYELQGFVPTGQITAITASGTNANVVSVEG